MVLRSFLLVHLWRTCIQLTTNSPPQLQFSTQASSSCKVDPSQLSVVPAICTSRLWNRYLPIVHLYALFFKISPLKSIKDPKIKSECAPTYELLPFNSQYKTLFKREHANLALLWKLAIKTHFEPISAERVSKTPQIVSYFVKIPCKRPSSPRY